jgi:hypothetical protein
MALWETEKTANRPAVMIAIITNADQIRLSVIVMIYEMNIEN